MTGLLTLEQFRTARDEMALASMRDRGRKLQPKLTATWDEVLRWRRWRTTLKQFEIASSYNLTKEQSQRRMRVINLRDKVQGKLDEAYQEWAAIETEISAIARDPRYIAWKSGKELKAIERDVVTLVDSMMLDVFGLKRAVGE